MKITTTYLGDEILYENVNLNELGAGALSGKYFFAVDVRCVLKKTANYYGDVLAISEDDSEFRVLAERYKGRSTSICVGIEKWLESYVPVIREAESHIDDDEEELSLDDEFSWGSNEYDEPEIACDGLEVISSGLIDKSVEYLEWIRAACKAKHKGLLNEDDCVSIIELALHNYYDEHPKD